MTIKMLVTRAAILYPRYAENAVVDAKDAGPNAVVAIAPKKSEADGPGWCVTLRSGERHWIPDANVAEVVYVAPAAAPAAFSSKEEMEHQPETPRVISTPARGRKKP